MVSFSLLNQEQMKKDNNLCLKVQMFHGIF